MVFADSDVEYLVFTKISCLTLKAQKQRSYEAIGALSFADSPFACPESAQSNLKSSYDNWINMCVLVFRFQMNHYILYKDTANWMRLQKLTRYSSLICL